MGTAKRDVYGVPGLLGHGQEQTVAVRATEQGSLCVTDSKKLLRVIRLPLDIVREMEQIAAEPYNELTVNVLDNPVHLNFVDAADESKTVTIVRPMSITAAAEQLWVSHEAAEAGAVMELWLWG